MEAQDTVGTKPETGAMLQQALLGNEEATAQLLSCHARSLYRTAYRLLGCPEDAEDAVQDGLLSALKNLNSFKGRSKFSTWLTRIVINSALMHLRKSRQLAFISIEQEPIADGNIPLASRIADKRSDPEEAYARQEQLQILERLMERLPDTCRLALWLCDVKG